MLGHAAIRELTCSNAVAAQSARIRHLTLTDFRSYQRATVAFDGRPVAIAGPNGSGKTNLLEAISLVAPGRGIRSARLHELPRQGGPGDWAVALRVGGEAGDERRLGVGVTAAQPLRRICRVDNQNAKGPGVLADHLRFMWLTPAQDRLFMEGGSERRKFIDRLTLAHGGAHGRTAVKYEKAMRQRQRLLEEGGRDTDWLGAIEKQMAEAGVAIAAARRETLALLAGNGISDNDGAFPAADLALDGDIETALARADAASVEDDFAERLRERRRLDADAGRALYGPHRSDLLVFHRQKMQPARLCSTGEQKALLVGLVLANANVLSANKDCGELAPPLILLLDEIAAHLDPERREALYAIIDELGLQAFMTGTDKSLFAAWGARAQYFETDGDDLSEQSLD